MSQESPLPTSPRRITPDSPAPADPLADLRRGSRVDDRDPATPPVPETLEETGLTAPFVADLLLKSLYRTGARSGRQLSAGIRLPFGLLDGLLLDLQQRHLIEVRRTEGHGRQGYIFDLTGEGRARAREAMSLSRYVGPAPVPFDSYVRCVERASVRDREVSPAEIRHVLEHLVLDEEFIDAVGAAANSGTALFLYGDPGNGKTAVARALADVAGDPIYVPYAVSVEGGTIVQLFDSLYHRAAEDGMEREEPQEESILRRPPAHDPRFARVRRPAVTVGGELTMDQLELKEDPSAGVFRAPLQLKANGGVFVLDDFGRQRIPARDLLNRWMIPLEERRDYLALPTGHKLPVPFDCFLVFSTNLEPTDLVEEAFLRRLRYKVAVSDPSRDQYGTIFRGCCEARGLEYTEEAVDRIYAFYANDDIRARACHPRDLVAHICDEARYRGEPPRLSAATVDRACRTYFLDVSPAGSPADVDSASTPTRDA